MHCIYNEAARNRITIALDDCVTKIARNVDVMEEGTLLFTKIVIPLDGAGKSEQYCA